MSFCFLSLLVAGAAAAAASESLMPSPPPQSHFRPNLALLGVIFAAFVSFIFLFIFYLKQRNRHGGQAAAPVSPDLPNFSPSRRRHSGVEREMVERLPLFLFAALVGQKQGLECAVCLSRFNEAEALRLLPKCRHAFHVECVDKWLEAHSSCPLCRALVGPEDVLLPVVLEDAIPPRARHSSAGETSTKSVLRALDPREIGARRSVDYVALRKGRAVGAESRLGEWRKDVMLMERRFGHQIVVDGGGSGGRLSLRSEMIITDCGRFSASRVEGRAPSEKRVNGKRSMSEMTGLRGGARWRMEGVVVEEPTMRRWLEGGGGPS